MTKAECNRQIAEHLEAIISIAKEFIPGVKDFSAGYNTMEDGSERYFLFAGEHPYPIDIWGTYKQKWNNVNIEFDGVTETFRVLVDGVVKFEHLAKDEVSEVVRNLIP